MTYSSVNNKRRVTSLLVLLAFSLGVASIDYHFCRDDEPLKPMQSSRVAGQDAATPAPSNSVSL